MAHAPDQPQQVSAHHWPPSLLPYLDYSAHRLQLGFRLLRLAQRLLAKRSVDGWVPEESSMSALLQLPDATPV